jgi:tetratricopeptide (TPR) repeat protein
MDEGDINQKILGELGKIKRILRIISIVFILIAILYIIVVPITIIQLKRQDTYGGRSLSWNRVQYLIDKGSFDKAEQMVLIFLKNNPKDYYPHAMISKVYLRTGNFNQALKHAEIACRLFPDKYNEETLNTLKKRLENEKAKATRP